MTIAAGATWVLAIVGWIAALAFLRSGRIWLPYYLVGAVGFAVGVVLLGQGPLPLERWMAEATARGAAVVAAACGIPTRVFPGAAGSILVLVVRQPVGWTMVTVGVECSGLLEAATIAGLTLFYPLWGAKRRAWIVLAGLVATGVANIARVAAIVATLHWGGKDALFAAHSLIGRGLFFALVVAIYWLALTAPTIRTIGARRLPKVEGRGAS
jgi:exosortase family protein XrtG